ncbi:MAG: class 1 fructose-bisphosphatase [Haloarculaceae archaeon]
MSATFEWVDDPVVAAVCETLVGSVPPVRRALAERRAYVDRENPSGERVRAADEFADELLEERLLARDGVASYASEERADPVFDDPGDAEPADGYHLAVDPLDGSSNLRSNSPMGTIVGVYDRPLPASGEHLVAAAFVLYGPNTTMVVADGDRASEYLVTGEGADRLTDRLTVPEDPTVYGMGGRRPDWTDRVTAVTESFEADRLKLRYGGAFVADVTQVLTHGGIFGYPELRDAPEGKLRYHFECAPTSLVVESAGGAATTGERDWRAVEPTDLHERSPVYLGTGSLVAEVEERFR